VSRPKACIALALNKKATGLLVTKKDKFPRSICLRSLPPAVNTPPKAVASGYGSKPDWSACGGLRSGHFELSSGSRRVRRSDHRGWCPRRRRGDRGACRRRQPPGPDLQPYTAQRVPLCDAQVLDFEWCRAALHHDLRVRVRLKPVGGGLFGWWRRQRQQPDLPGSRTHTRAPAKRRGFCLSNSASSRKQPPNNADLVPGHERRSGCDCKRTL
jgi:hypothetical protein